MCSTINNEQSAKNISGVGQLGNNIFNAAIDSIKKDVNANQQIKDLASAVQSQINELHRQVNSLTAQFQEQINGKRIAELESTKTDCKFWDNWFVWGIGIILLGAGLFFMIPVIQDNYIGGILGFVGILATFIVVSQYIQVKEVKDEFHRIGNKMHEIESLEKECIKEKNRVDTLYKAINDRERRKKEYLYSEFKRMYYELLDIIKKDDFKEHGFRGGGPYNHWIVRVEKLKNGFESDLLLAERPLFVYLDGLGILYEASKGEETPNIKQLNEFFENELKE
jgi:hypothetical protein